jgi:hypothetical protein
MSPGHNEVQASYTVPTVGYPFAENGEGGTGKGSWGSPWGLTDVSVRGGAFAWTDSPGTNYEPNPIQHDPPS